MAEIVNLRLARKARQRAKSDADASENRARFGQNLADRRLAEARDALASTRYDGHRLTPAPADDS